MKLFICAGLLALSSAVHASDVEFIDEVLLDDTQNVIEFCEKQEEILLDKNSNEDVCGPIDSNAKQKNEWIKMSHAETYFPEETTLKFITSYFSDIFCIKSCLFIQEGR